MSSQPSEKSRDAAVTSDREIVISRRFEAPVESVWRAWTEPEHVSQWWGPQGFTTTIQEMDVRPGGVWRFVMHGPDGTDYQNFVRFVEVERPRRLVYNHGEDEETIYFSVIVTFVPESDGATVVTLRQVYDTAEARDYAVKEFHAIEGGNQTLARLADYLRATAF